MMAVEKFYVVEGFGKGMAFFHLSILVKSTDINSGAPNFSHELMI